MTARRLRLFIARHGNTFDPGDAVLRIGARTDLPLSTSGLAQAHALGAHFRDHNVSFDTIYVSPLHRARQTGECIANATTRPPKIFDAEFLTEIDYGPDEGKPERDVVARVGADALARWESHSIAPPGWVVNPAEIRKQWRGFFYRVLSQDASSNAVLAVTSNGVARFAREAAGAGPDESGKLRTGAYGEICLSRSSPEIINWDQRP